MSQAEKEALFQAVIDRDDGWQTLVNEAWDCLLPDDRMRIYILAQG